MHLLVFSPFYPPHVGGLESHSDEFNRAFAVKGVRITVFTPRLPETAPETELRFKSVKVIRFPAVEIIHNYPFPKFWDARFWQAWASLSREDYDVVISRTRFFFTSLLTWRFARKKRTPWVHIEHGSDFAHFNSVWKTRLGHAYDQTFGRFVLRSSDLNIANSEASKGFVEFLSGRPGCQVIYRGVPEEVITNFSSNKERTEEFSEKILIGFIGRLIDGKGVNDLLTAFAEIKNTNALLLIVGEGPERRRLENRVRELQLEKKVRFYGHLVPNEALKVMAACDIIVNPSYTEGIPTAVIEAALLKKAIIATDVGGTREIITGSQDGILVPARDAKALQEALEAFLENQAFRKQSGENASLRVKDRFSWDKAVEQYASFFAQLK